MKSQRLLSLIVLMASILGCAPYSALPTTAPTATEPTPSSTPTVVWTPTPSLVPAISGKVVFALDGDIYMMNDDGSGRAQLTSGPLVDTSPELSPDGTRIVFLSGRDSVNGALYVMNGDGSQVTRLFHTLAADSDPHWSPDGRRVAFVSYLGGFNFDIFVINADGSGQTNLTDSPMTETEPDWSPDGNRIAYTYDYADANSREIRIRIVDVATGQVVEPSPSHGGSSPKWSPDGKSIACVQMGEGGGIIIIDPENEAARRYLTDGWDPAWSPDGRRIAFGRWNTSDGSYTVHVVNADGGYVLGATANREDGQEPFWSADGRWLYRYVEHNGKVDVYGINTYLPTPTPSLTPTPSPTLTPTLIPPLSGSGGGVIAFVGYNTSFRMANADDSVGFEFPTPSIDSFTWAPDGEQLAFAGEDGDIYVMGVDGAGKTNLTNSPAKDSKPSWSPDGKWIAFVSDSDLYIIGPDASGQKRLTTDMGIRGEVNGSTPFGEYLVWSPDGTKIAFVSDRNGPSDIFVVNADGSGSAQRIAIGGDPNWSPDGQQIAYASGGDIIVTKSDGSGYANLTNGQGHNSSPDWSPDGKRIAFSSDRRISPGDLHSELYIMNADGSGIVPLSDYASLHVGDPHVDAQPDWSPDGRQIAFIVLGWEATANIYIVNADGSHRRRISGTDLTSGSFVSQLAWRP